MFDIDPKITEAISKNSYVVAFVGAFVGAFVAVAKTMPGSTYIEKLVNLICGTALGGMLAPGAADYFNLHTEGMRMAVAVFIGLFGLNGTAAVWDWFKSAKLADYLPWKKRND